MSEYLTVAEVAETYGVSQRAVRLWVQEGKLSPVLYAQVIEGRGPKVMMFDPNDVRQIHAPVRTDHASNLVDEYDAEFDGAQRYIADLERALRSIGFDPLDKSEFPDDWTWADYKTGDWS